MAAYDDLNVKRILSVGILSVVVTAVTALAVQVIYYWMVQVQTAETAEASDYTRQNTILEQQQSEIATYGVDPQTGNIMIPIDQAIKHLIAGDKTDSTAEDRQASEDQASDEPEKDGSEQT